MGSVNKVILVGHLGKDPEIRTLTNGDCVANLTVATSETWRDKQSGERKEKTEWHRVVIFNEHAAKVAEKYLRKGSPVYLEGSLQTRKWTDNGGVERYSTEIVLQKFKGELTLLGGGEKPQESDDSFRSDAGGGRAGGMAGGGRDPARENLVRGLDRIVAGELDDEIPF